MRAHAIGAALALFLLAAAPAAATVLVPADMTELAREAAVIVRGRVVSVQAVWTAGRRSIETVVTLEVAEALKGAPGREVSLRVPGGELGRYRSVMVGAPAFQEGQEVIVFLGGRAPQLSYLLGLGQGVYRVRRLGAAGVAMVSPPLALADPAGPVRVRRGDPARRALPLEEFTRQVKQAAIGSVPPERPAPRPGRGKEGR
jgi:hypothetical protein